MTLRLRRDARVARLRHLAFLSALPDRALSSLADVVVEQDLAPGTALTRQGHAGGTAYVLVDGEAVVERDGIELARLRPGEVIGELSLLDREPRSATVTAATPLHVLAVAAEDLHRLLLREPPLAIALLGVLARRVRALDGQVVDRR